MLTEESKQNIKESLTKTLKSPKLRKAVFLEMQWSAFKELKGDHLTEEDVRAYEKEKKRIMEEPT